MDRSATKALLQQELKAVHQQLRRAQTLANAGQIEQSVEVASRLADRAWGVVQILHAEELLNRWTKT